jgi:hypothetical protein
LVDGVKAGSPSLAEAYEKALKAKKQQDLDGMDIEAIRKIRPDLADRDPADKLTKEEAKAIIAEAERKARARRDGNGHLRACKGFL